MPQEQPPKPTVTRAIGLACDSIIVQIVRFLSYTGISPNALTAIGLGINVYAAYLLSKGNFWAGGWVIVGASIFDMVDAAWRVPPIR